MEWNLYYLQVLNDLKHWIRLQVQMYNFYKFIPTIL